MLDPKAKFIISHLTREDIAENLNEYYVDCTGKEAVLTPDDDRLTDELCQGITDKLAEIDADCADAGKYRDDRINEAEGQLWYDTLAKMGFDMTYTD